MGNEMSNDGGTDGETRSYTHLPDSSSNNISTAPPQNVAVETESNQPIVRNDEPVKINDEQIIRRAGIKSSVVKKDGEEPPPPPSQKEQLQSIKLVVKDPPPTQMQKLNRRQVKNAAGGFSFKVCDINRLRRYIVLGSEHSTFYAQGVPDAPQLKAVENINCLKNLLEQKRHEEVLETITQYSLSGRVAKEDPILIVLAQCAGHEDDTIRKAALKRVVKICNIPTKLFRFIDLHQELIDLGRKKNPPAPQKWKTEENKKRKNIAKGIEDIKLEGADDVEMKTEEGKPKEPCENTDTSIEAKVEGAPPSKKKKKEKKPDPEFKKVNTTAKKSSGWGRMRRKAIAEFYTDETKDGARLLYLMTKYKSRHNWSHQSVVTYSHPKMKGENAEAKNLVVKYCTGGYDKVKTMCSEEAACKPGLDQKMSETINYINKLEEVIKLDANKEEDLTKLLEILNTYGIREQQQDFLTTTTFGDEKKQNTEGKKSPIQIVREHLPTGFLKNKEVWKCLVRDMPMTALIRNLGKITSMGIFDEQEFVDMAVRSLTNVHKLKTARVHPMKVLIALQQYQKGHGDKGSLTWVANHQITKALDDAFYKSFKQPELAKNFKTNLNYMLCLDVSGSMSFGGCVGCELITPAMASVAMAWVTWNVEDNVEVMAFGGHLEDMKKRGFHKDMLIHDAMHKTSQINFGSTDCSLPMVYAKQHKQEIDVFIVYTDSDTWSGRMHPVTALDEYNKTMKRDAKLIVCGMQSNGFTIADPQDPNMMDIVGFDSNVPELISEFAKGRLSGTCSGGDGNCPDCDVKE